MRCPYCETEITQDVGKKLGNATGLMVYMIYCLTCEKVLGVANLVPRRK